MARMVTGAHMLSHFEGSRPPAIRRLSKSIRSVRWTRLARRHNKRARGTLETHVSHVLLKKSHFPKTSRFLGLDSRATCGVEQSRAGR